MSHVEQKTKVDIQQDANADFAGESQQYDDGELTTKKILNKAIAYACRLLGMREYSEKMLRQKLFMKGFEDHTRQLTIDYLLENNWLSDQRFCEVYIRSKANRGLGLSRIAYELGQKGISDGLFLERLAEQNIDWQANCEQVTAKKIQSAKLENNIKDRQKLERFLRYRGFSGQECRVSINKFMNKNNMGVVPSEHD